MIEVTCLVKNSRWHYSVIFCYDVETHCSYSDRSHLTNEYIDLAFFSYFVILRPKLDVCTMIKVTGRMYDSVCLPSVIFLSRCNDSMFVPWSNSYSKWILLSASIQLLSTPIETLGVATPVKVAWQMNKFHWLYSDIFSFQCKDTKLAVWSKSRDK